MRAGLVITQEETIRTRADNHRETGDTRTSKQDKKTRQKLRVMTATRSVAKCNI